MKKLIIISIFLLILTIGAASAAENTTADDGAELKISDDAQSILKDTNDIQVDEYIEALPCPNQIIEIRNYPDDAKGNVSISIDGESQNMINENYQEWGDEYGPDWIFDGTNLTYGTHIYELNFSGDSKYSPVTRTGTINITPMVIQFPSTTYIEGTHYTDTDDFGLMNDYSQIKIRYLKDIKGNMSLYINGVENIRNLSDYNASQFLDGRYDRYEYNLIKLDKSGEFYVYQEHFYLYTPSNLTVVYRDELVSVNRSGFVNVTYYLDCADEVIKGDDLEIYIPKSVASRITIEIDGKPAKLYSKRIVRDYEYLYFYGETSSLGYGTHTIRIDFKGNENCSSRSEYRQFNVVHQPRIAPKTINIYYTDSKTCQFTIYGTDGKKLSGKYETHLWIDYNWDSLISKNTNNGKFSYKIPNNLKPGTHKLNVWISDQDLEFNVKLVVKHIVTLKKVTVKKSAKKLTLQATLKKGKTPLKNKKVTFKFNGKTYKAKTNSKGIAKVTIKSKVLKKLKAGKKVTYQATYLKDTVKKTVKVKK